MPRRQANLRATQEFVDELTGTPVGPGVRGGAASGRRLVRVRPEAGAPFELVAAEGDTYDPRRDTYGIETSATPFYRQQAAAQAAAGRKAKRRKPLTRDSEIDLGKIGAATTFKTAGQAAQTFMDHNAALFDSALFEDLDVYDLTRDFMDKIEVRIGKHHERLHDTARGEEILGAARGRAGSDVAKQMLTYLMGMAGPRRRWRDVPWALVDEYVAELGDAVEREAQRQHKTPPAPGIAWYPVASGMYEGTALLRTAIDELGNEPAQRIADWMSSQALFDLADRIDAIIAPPKGPEGAAARRLLRCIPGSDRKMIRHRASVMRQWAAEPQSVPAWACGAERVLDGVSLCEFPGLYEDVRRIESACQAPYDPGWPTNLEHLGRDLDERPLEDLDLPWEQTAANPDEWTTLARRLANGGSR